jgi:hypothetical protein
MVFTYPGIISRAELVPSHGASRRRLGFKITLKDLHKFFARMSTEEGQTFYLYEVL